MSSYNFSINGGSGGADLWQLISAAPSPIELNTTNGASGIQAPFPADSRFSLQLGAPSFSPADVAAMQVFLDTVNQVLLIVGPYLASGGNPQALLNAVNIANSGLGQVIAQLDSAGNGLIEMVANAITGSGTANTSVGIDPGGDGLFNFTISDNAGNNYSVELDSDGLFFKYNTTKLFAIPNNGNLQTNQVAAGAPAAALPTKKLPIYDGFGTFQGFAPIYLT